MARNAGLVILINKRGVVGVQDVVGLLDAVRAGDVGRWCGHVTGGSEFNDVVDAQSPVDALSVGKSLCDAVRPRAVQTIGIHSIKV